MIADVMKNFYSGVNYYDKPFILTGIAHIELHYKHEYIYMYLYCQIHHILNDDHALSTTL